jgi:hypothetical protein
LKSVNAPTLKIIGLVKSQVSKRRVQRRQRALEQETNHYRRVEKLRAIHRKHVAIPEFVVASHYTAPRHTVVLCHGKLGLV